MISPVGKLRRFWRNERMELARAFQNVVVFVESLSREALKERNRAEVL